MQTGHPLYVVGTSIFGTTGGYLIPGLMMGLLQIGRVAVVGAVSADFIKKGVQSNIQSPIKRYCCHLDLQPRLGSHQGIHYFGRVAKFLNWVPLIMILIVFLCEQSRHRELSACASRRNNRLPQCTHDRN
jgi:cytosine permease